MSKELFEELDLTVAELRKENQELKEKIKKLSQWDINKDTRNSRQRVANAKLIKENQELREKLDKYENPEDMTLMMMWCTEQVKDENKKLKKKYENAVADYETTMAEKNKLKKQLENKYEKVGTLTTELLYEENTKLINQQKEFIKWLEDKIKFSVKPTSRVLLKSIWANYKEIIGEELK